MPDIGLWYPWFTVVRYWIFVTVHRVHVLGVSLSPLAVCRLSVARLVCGLRLENSTSVVSRLSCYGAAQR